MDRQIDRERERRRIQNSVSQTVTNSPPTKKERKGNETKNFQKFSKTKSLT
jgi:hypothetical protein